MSSPTPTKFKVASVFTAVLISIGVIALAGSVLMPSTKRARIDLTERLEEPETAAPAPSAPVPSSSAQPASRAS